MVILTEAKQIIFPQHWWEVIISHCRRKLEENFLPDETPERKAYGLISGVQQGATVEVRGVYPLRKNQRGQAAYQECMDELMRQHAIPSKTPFERRGWVADPQEVNRIYTECGEKGESVFGSYHMHIVPWVHDPVRDSPTEIDTTLAQETNMCSFIISMVDPQAPRMRAFYEGRADRELPILIK